MKVFISNKEIEEIASGLIQVACGQQKSGQIDIDSVARFLGLPVLYEQIMEDDMDKIGYLSNGSYPLYVKRDNQRVGMVYPKDTIILDSFLQQPSENCRRRFVLAHEIGHVLINRADPLHNPACFDRDYDQERDYNFQELREHLTLGECQANTMAALLLMPKQPSTRFAASAHKTGPYSCLRGMRSPSRHQASRKRHGKRIGCFLFSPAYPAEKV